MSDFRLKAFYSVARNLSFTKASQELFVSQPAVTKHVRELESLYGVRLFDRKGNSISLTEAGQTEHSLHHTHVNGMLLQSLLHIARIGVHQ